MQIRDYVNTSQVQAQAGTMQLQLSLNLIKQKSIMVKAQSEDPP